MKGDHSVVEHLGHPGHLFDRHHRQARSFDRMCRPARGDELEAELGEAARELLEAGLVVDGEERAAGHWRERKRSVEELSSDLRQQPVFYGMESLEQRLWGVARENRDALLSQDRSGVDTFVDFVHRDAGLGRPRRERIGDSLGPGNAGSSDGWTLITLRENLARKPAVRSCM